MSASAKLAVGLVGAGPWANFVHAPMLANGAKTALAGVWARRPEAATQLATKYGAPAFTDYDDLLAHCDAVAFCVPPDVQAAMACTAARAAKAVLLEKPIGLDLDEAVHLVDVIESTGVVSQVMLSWRYSAAFRSFLADVHASMPIGGRGRFLSGALLGGPFATPWRLDHGALLDLGPHVLDGLDAALGRIVRVRAHGHPKNWIGLLVEHESGLASEASLCASTAVDPFHAGLEVYTREGAITFDAATGIGVDAFTVAAEEFADAVRTSTPHPLDAGRALHLQRLLAQALTDLR